MAGKTYEVEVLIGSRWSLTIVARSEEEAESIANSWTPEDLLTSDVRKVTFIEADRSVAAPAR